MIFQTRILHRMMSGIILIFDFTTRMYDPSVYVVP